MPSFLQQSRFTKCAVCVHIKEQLSTSDTGEELRKELQLMRKIHITQQLYVYITAIKLLGTLITINIMLNCYEH